MKARRFFGLVPVLALLVVTSSGVGCALVPALTGEAAWHTPAYPDLMPVGGGDLCPALDPPTGSTVTVSTVTELQDAVNTATSGTTILLTDGTCNLDGVCLRFAVPNVTLRSASGNRENVVMDDNYNTTAGEIIQIVASNITIADLTLREAYNHPIHVTSSDSADTTGTLIYNVHIVDPGEQAIKIMNDF